MALHDHGVEAISFTGSQSGILTDSRHRSARIVDVRPERLRAELGRGRAVIVAGFQGVNPDTKEITTLGRGGSDTTAVALAAALGPATCEIYTDVGGVLTADPRVVPDARVLPSLSYSLCSTLAHLGGRVLHARCVDLAARARVPVVVRSSFDDAPGTRIESTHEEDLMKPGALEAARVVAVTHRSGCSIAVAEGTSGGRGEARGIIAAVADAHPELELLVHEVATDAHGAIAKHFRELRGPGGEWRLGADHGASFVSIVGLGLGASEIVRAEAALDRAAVPLVALRTTPTAIILRVSDSQCENAVRVLHAEFIG
jgi:aspartate kinase